MFTSEEEVVSRARQGGGEAGGGFGSGRIEVHNMQDSKSKSKAIFFGWVPDVVALLECNLGSSAREELE